MQIFALNQKQREYGDRLVLTVIYLQEYNSDYNLLTTEQYRMVTI